jgi:poly-gamma-glutamate synthase PgsB/CapB
MNLILLVSFLIMVGYLALESYLQQKRLKKVPRRIAVTGIRGKSSITRLIASGLKEAGFKVMAKTTGSRPVLIYPDGREKEIRRRGKPTILEQKTLVSKAVEHKADYLVSEMMSIQPECLQAESRYLLRPEILVLSNIRLDHLDQMGESREEIARSLSTAFPTRGIIFIPEEESFPWMVEEARRKGSEVILVKKDPELENLKGILPYPEFETNVRLAAAVLKHRGLSADQIIKGFGKVIPDYGSLKVWKKAVEGSSKPCYFASLFAANDPESTMEAMDLVVAKAGGQNQNIIGLLSLRGDRLDRTRQWADFLIKEKTDNLNSLALVGPGSKALQRYLKKSLSGRGKRVLLIRNQEPEECLEKITAFAPSGDEAEVVIFGLGNIGGFGQKMIDYLERTADAVKL